MKTIITTIMILISLTGLSTNYYVNDNSMAGDVYCTAVGASGNTGTTSSPFLKLSSAISVASSGDFIYVDAGTYTSDFAITFTTTNLTITGAGRTKTIFDRSSVLNTTDYFMYIKANGTTIKDLCVQYYDNNGTQIPGRSASAITIGGSNSSTTGVVIDNVAFLNNGNNSGNPTISVQKNSTVLIKNGGNYCNLTGSTSSGGIESYGTSINLTIMNYLIAYNYKTTSNGGGLYINGDPTNIVVVKNSVISNNYSTYGGGIAQEGGNVTMLDCIIDNNSLSSSGSVYGAGYYISCGVSRLSRCVIKNNGISSTRGSGISCRYINQGAFSSPKTISMTIDSCKFENNFSSATGTDIYAANGSSQICNVTIRDCRFLTSQASGKYNICSDATSKATTISTTYFGIAPSTINSTLSGSITPVLSSNNTYLASPNVPTYSGNCAGFVLPIELLSFYGKSHIYYNELRWVTASEHNNDYFTIEKTRDGTYFYNVAVIKGAGNSVQKLEYQYLDRDIEDGISYYILKQTDYDGKFKYSDIISIDNRKEASPTLIKVTNTLGQEVTGELKGVLIFHYSDGTTIKRVF